jgi:hypothetical protein
MRFSNVFLALMGSFATGSFAAGNPSPNSKPNPLTLPCLCLDFSFLALPYLAGSCLVLS